MGFIKPNNNSGGSGGGLTPQELSRLNNAYTHSKSEHAPTTAEQNVQPDWNETDTTSDAYIKNKPDLSQIGSGGNIPSVTQIEPQELDMPKVFFYGNALPTTKDNVNLTMDYISNTTKFSSFVKLKCQGTSSMSYAKKNFTVTMYSDEARATKLKKDFKGWGAQSKFCLKANYVDTTHTRNISGARIAYDMVASRPDSEFKQQLLQCPRNGAVDGFPIKLYFNGEFYGIYTWNIPKDGWMFNMDKNNPNHVVLCAERNTDGNANAINSCQFRKLWTDGDGGDWSVEFGTYSTEMVASLNRCINFVMTSTNQEFHDNISEYFDLYSLLDYYCFSYLTCHLDGLAKNMLMVTYDGVIWGACLYDMDSIYGVHWNGNSYVATNYQCPEQYQEQFSLLWKRIEANFATELYARYRELRQGALSLSNIIKHVEEIYDVIPDRVFTDEKAKWTSLPQVNTNTMTRFRNYMRDRAIYVDSQMQEIGTNIPCTGIVLSTDTLSFTTTDTQTLSVVVSPENCTETVTWSVNPTGIATVKNGVVTPIRNGQATITATCGSQSATCAVTVSGMSEGGGDTGGYTDIGYIESTGTQYINTRIVPTASTKIELVAEMSASKQYDHIFGSDNFMKAQWSDGTGTVIEAVKKNGQNPVSGLTLGKHTYVMDMTDTANVITIDGATYGNNIGHVESTTNPLLLLCGYKNDETIETELCGIGKIYSCKIYYEDTLVANMKPVLTNSGTYGLLDTVNNTFYASEVGNFTGGNTPVGEDTGIYATAEYAITEPRVFNGTSDYIDTGIKLFDTAKTFTIFVDYTSNTPTPSNQATIFHCIHEEPPYRGLCLMKAQNNGLYFIGGQVNTLPNYTSEMPAKGKYLISFVNGVINEIVTVDNSGNLVHSATDMASDNPYAQISENLLIGCYQDTSGTKGRYWSGTINKFGVWYKQLTSDEINKVFGKNGGGTDISEPTRLEAVMGTFDTDYSEIASNIRVRTAVIPLEITGDSFNFSCSSTTWEFAFKLSDNTGNVSGALNLVTNGTLEPDATDAWGIPNVNYSTGWLNTRGGTVSVNSSQCKPSYIRMLIRKGTASDTFTIDEIKDLEFSINGTSYKINKTEPASSLLYELPQETTFNGTSDFIDTGVALLSTDQDFTIVLDVTATNPQRDSNATLLHCMHEESPYHGLSFMTSRGDNGFYIPKGSNAGAIGKLPYLIPLNERAKVVVIKEGTRLSAYNSNYVTASSTYTYSQVNENLLIGAYQTTDGVKGRYFSGTVHDFKIYSKAFTSKEIDGYLNINGGGSRVFKIDSTSMNTAENTLTDNIAGISATLTGNPTVSDNQIAFTANDKFSFDLSSLNLTSSNRTLRVKFTPTTLDNTPKNVMTLGSSATAWNSATTCYINSGNLVLQHGSNSFANVTTGSGNGGDNNNRLTTSPVTGQEYELVISEHTNGNIKWFIDGVLVQDGTTTLFNPLYIGNTEGTSRFIGSYSLIEIYDGYCNDYTEFTNMVNNA